MMQTWTALRCGREMGKPLTTALLAPLRLRPCRSPGEGIITTDPLLSWCQMKASSQPCVHSNGGEAGNSKGEQPLAAHGRQMAWQLG